MVFLPVAAFEKPFAALAKNLQMAEFLDFPSGYGRVLRFLRAMFPNSDITAAEIDRRAFTLLPTFLRHSPFVKIPFSDLNLSRRFHLVWCGSLLTHIDEQAASDLLQFFHDDLSDRGLCVFTTMAGVP